MTDRVYKKIELAASSTVSFDQAIESTIKKAHESVKNLSWFEVKEMRGSIKDGQVVDYQVVVQLGFAVE